MRRRRRAQACHDISDIITDVNRSTPDRFISVVGRDSRDRRFWIHMIAQPYHLYVERTDVAKNMARYYAMSIEPNLLAMFACSGSGAALARRVK